MVAIGLAGLFAVILALYAPALRGHFVFDDLSLPFAKITRDSPLADWVAGVRPVLMLSYWANYKVWGADPFSFHFVNVLIHFVNSILVFLVLWRLLEKTAWTRRKSLIAAGTGAVLFAIHPLATESVSYIAGRSESLMSLFLLLAYAVFLFRRQEAISWTEAVLVLLLFGLAVKTKENAVSFAGILVLTDAFWPEPFSLRGLRRNWRLYSLMAPGVAAAIVMVFRVLATASSAGFSVATFRWYQYAFTEARAMFTYVQLALLPVGQSIDQDYPTSHTVMEHGALLYLLLLAGIVVLAVAWRRRYPLFCFGLLMFLIWLAPTSSIVPLDDALVERRMYVPLVGLILIGCEVGSRLRLRPAAAVAACVFLGVVFGTFCYERNRLWGTPDRLIELAAAGAVYNPRPLLNFSETLIQQNRCELGPPLLERAERELGPNNYFVNAAWGRMLACLGRFDDAVARLQKAARLGPCSQVYEWMGLVYGQMGRLPEAGEALRKAVDLAPNSESAHGSLALWYEKTDNLAAAEREYTRAISLDGGDTWAKLALLRVHGRERP